MNRYTIRKVFLWPAFKFGALIGAVLMIVPGIVWGLLVREAAQLLRGLYGTPSLFTLTRPDVPVLFQRLIELAEKGPALVLGTALLSIIGGGLAYGISALVAALFYNLIASLGGGLAVAADMSALPVPAPAPVVQPSPVMQPQPAAYPPAPAAQPPQPVAAQPQGQFQAAPVIQQAAPVVRQAVPVVQPQPPAPSGPWLAFGQDPNQRWPLRPDCTRLGSAPDNTILLQGIAAHHAEIRFENGFFVLHDLAAGQTWVNDRLVAGRNMLKDGFRIRLGGYEMIFHVS
jgi:hypothetical protein